MWSPTRASKRRLDEIDDRIESSSKVINTLKGYDRTYFNNRLLGVRLKQQKLIGLSAFAEHQRMQILLAEIDVLVVENDLNVDIEAIRNCKKFKRTEKLLREESKSEDLNATRIIEEISGHSTPINSVPEKHTRRILEKNSKYNDISEEVTSGPFECFEKGLVSQNSAKITPLIIKRQTSKNKMDKTQSKSFEAKEIADDVFPIQLQDPPTSSMIKKKSRRTKKHQISLQKTKVTEKNAPNYTIKKEAVLPEENRDDVVNLFKIYKKIYLPQNEAVNGSTPENLPSFSMSPQILSTDTINTIEDGSKSTHKSTIATKSDISEELFPKDKTYKKSKACSTKTAKTTTKPEVLGTKTVRTAERTYPNSKKGEPSKCCHSTTEEAMNIQKSKAVDVLLKEDEEAIVYMNKLVTMCCAAELSKRAQHSERNAQNTSEELFNGSFKELMASNRVKLETNGSSGNSVNCTQCGVVSVGHMSAVTIREILENC